MREIKFRAWDKKQKRMIYNVASIHFEKSGELLCISEFVAGRYFPKDIFADNIILMQYTGLKDKNGREIYEGDIVKVKNHTFGEKYRNYLCFMVNRDKRTGAWELFFINNKGKMEVAPDWANTDLYEGKVEIIGNIYENPELLKEEEK